MYININNKAMLNEIKRVLFPRWKSVLHRVSITVYDGVDLKTNANRSTLCVYGVKSNGCLFSKICVVDIERLDIFPTMTIIFVSRKGKRYRIVTLNP